jgi:hypothetical protein
MKSEMPFNALLALDALLLTLLIASPVESAMSLVLPTIVSTFFSPIATSATVRATGLSFTNACQPT